MIERNPDRIASVVPSSVIYAAPARVADGQWGIRVAFLVSLAAAPLTIIANVMGIL